MGTKPTDPILLSVPESIESERLLIRAPLWGDGAAVNQGIRESIDELRPWMPWAQIIPTPDESESFIRRARLQFLERINLLLLLFRKETGEYIGNSGLHRIDWEARKFEIGYWIRTSCSKQGYMAEAVNAITNYAIRELQANRVEIRCDSRNTPSARVAQRTGFTLEGILRKESCDVEGRARDTMVFSKVRGIEF